MGRTRATSLGALIAAAALVLTACGGSGGSGGAAPPTPAPTQNFEPGKAVATDTPFSRPKVADIGDVAVTVDEGFQDYNNNTGSANSLANQYVTPLLTPSPFFTDEHTTLRLDTDYMQSVTVTSQNPQVVEYKWRPEAVWSDGAPVGCKDMYLLYLAAVSPVKDGDAQIFDSSPTGYDQISKIDCSADQKTVTRHLRHPLRRLPGPVERRRSGGLGDAARAHPRAAHRDRRHHQGRPPGGHPAAAGRRHVLHDRVERLRPGRRAVRRAVPDRELGAQRGDRARAQREVVGQPGGPRQGHDHGRHRLAGERAEAAQQGGPGHRPAGGIGRLRADPGPGRGLHRVRRGRPDLRAHRLQHGPAAVRRPPRAAQGRGHLPEPAAAAGQPHPQRRPERGAAGQLHLPAQRGGLRGPLRAVRHG